MFKSTYTALAMVLVVAVAAQAFGQSGNKEQSDKLVAILKSDASRQAKADACRQLAVVATPDAVPVLASLLSNPELNHMARYALEPLPSPAVDEALRAALDSLQGRPLVGVIGSIGVRRDAKAIPALGKLLGHADADVAQAAARALGKIGNADAARAIGAALSSASAPNQLAFCEGLFRCAEALGAAGEQAQAVAIYDQLRALNTPLHQVRTGALRGAILARGQDGMPLLKENLRSQDYLMFQAAVRTTNEMPGAPVTLALVDGMGQLPADNQVLILQTLAGRRDAAALPAVSAAAKTGAKEVRLAAFQAIAAIGSPAGAQVLAPLTRDSNREIAQAAQESLASIPGAEVDAFVTNLLNSAEADQKVLGIDLVARRRMMASVPTLLKLAETGQGRVRSTAVRTLGEMAGPAELPAMLKLLMASQDMGGIEQALSAVCGKAEKPDECSGKLVELLPKANAAQKTVLLRVLASLGGAEALKAVRATVNDAQADSEVRTTAIRALGTWKTADAAPDLLQLAKTAANPLDKLLSLRNYLTLAARSDLPETQRLAMCREAKPLVQRDEEKRLLLAALSSIPSLEAFEMIAPYLDEQGTREEAGSAAVAVADKIMLGTSAASAGPKMVATLEKVAKSSSNVDVTRRANSLVQRINRDRNR